MSAEEQGTLLAFDPDAPPARTGRASAGRGGHGRTGDLASVPESGRNGASPHPAEATLNLEPLRVPIATMVQGTLIAEREVLARMAGDLQAALERMQGWLEREEAMRADQTALYRRAAEEWTGAGDQAAGMRTSTEALTHATSELRKAVEAANARFWRRALVAAWVVSLAGLGLVVALCAVVWLALNHC